MGARPSHARSASAARSRSRRLAMQALYQWQMTAMDTAELVAQFEADAEFRSADKAYFEELLDKSIANITTLDEYFARFLDRKVEEVDPVERAILRLATYELWKRLDVPYKVVLNEAVALARKFGAEQSHTYVNGILDRVAPALRATEHPRGDPDKGLHGLGGA